MFKLFTRKNNDNNEQGFTMAEMVTVTAIIGILAAISIPAAVSTGNKVQNQAIEVLEITELAAESANGTLTPEEQAQLDAYRTETLEKVSE